MLVRLYAGEIIMGRITEDNVPREAEGRVHKYLVDMATSTTSRSKPNNKEGRVLRPSGFYEVTQ